MNILILNDLGCSERYLGDLMQYLNKHLSSTIEIKHVDARYLHDCNWEDSCCLLIIPGGRDRPYEVLFTSLNLHERVRSYVSAGGSYLGICAGAYFACKNIRFCEGNKENEIIECRKLALTCVDACGPINGNYYDYNAIGEYIECMDETTEILPFKLHYNGGPFFVNLDDEVDVLAYTKDRKPIVISSHFGSGRCILSGVHFEANDSHDDSSLKNKDEWVVSRLMRELLVGGRKCGNYFIHYQNGKMQNDTKIILDDSSHVLSYEIMKQRFFNVEDYCHSIDNESAANIYYFDEITSTQTVLMLNALNVLLNHKIAVFLANFQSRGKGRAGASWKSPSRCLQYTVGIRDSQMEKPQLIQYAVALVVCDSLRNITQSNEIYIKWPNDIYALDIKSGTCMKIGGILINAISGTNFFIFAGIGLNFGKNTEFFSLDEFCEQRKIEAIIPSIFLAKFMNQFIHIIEIMEHGIFPFQSYTNLWLHSYNTKILSLGTCQYQLILRIV